MWISCNNYYLKHIKFDIISCDPWTNNMEEFLFINLDKILCITNKYIITGFSKILSDKYNLNLDTKKIEKFINIKYNTNISIIKLMKRSDHLGGIFWLVIKV